MNSFYAYKGNAELGTESLGTEGKLIFELKTIRGAINRCRRTFGEDNYMLYKFTNFYDDTTFVFVRGKFIKTAL